jgi:biopolymer transport protein ExbD
MKLKVPTQEDAAIDMAPMIDMVFLLLIFFMVASTVSELSKKQVEIPVASNAKVPEQIADRRMLSIQADGEIFAGLEPVSLEELEVLLAGDMQRDAETGGATRVFIRADRELPFSTVREVMKVCARTGASDLIFATFETEK